MAVAPGAMFCTLVPVTVPVPVWPVVTFQPLLAVVATSSIAAFVANSCEPLMASVEEFEIRPAATLVIVRSAPTAPTLTVEVGVVPWKL
ncbi:hypothetical protein ASC92_23655 [Variovorax sp. Root411]|nr:hypothetical protein ASC92_23655 [Variovorax sp. Root411]